MKCMRSAFAHQLTTKSSFQYKSKLIISYITFTNTRTVGNTAQYSIPYSLCKQPKQRVASVPNQDVSRTRAASLLIVFLDSFST